MEKLNELLAAMTMGDFDQLFVMVIIAAALVFVTCKIIDAFFWWWERPSDKMERRKNLSDYAAGYKAGKAGPKNGVPIGRGLNDAFMKGVRDAQDVRKNA